jgi:colanic acid/amylovoran biosynthesis protein
MLVEIKGVHFGNRGAHLMLLATLERLVPALPALRVVLNTSPNASARQVTALGAWRKQKLRKRALDLNGLSYRWPSGVDTALNRRGTAAEGQIDAIVDASGYAYGGSWSPWLMAYAAAEMRRFAAHGKPYVFLPQAFGPFGAGRARAAFASALADCALVCVRDDRSAMHLRDLCPQLDARLVRFPDFTIGVSGDCSAAAAWGVDRESVLLIPNRHMAEARNPDRAWRLGYVQFLADLARRLDRSGRRVALLNHESREDAALCRQVALDSGGTRIIDEPDPRRIKGVIGAAGAVVSSRYHGCVAALSQGVPCLGTSWSHKYEALYLDFGVRDWLLGECDASAAAAQLERLLAERPVHAQQLADHASRLAAQTDTMWRRVLDLLNAAPRRWQ